MESERLRKGVRDEMSLKVNGHCNVTVTVPHKKEEQPFGVKFDLALNVENVERAFDVVIEAASKSAGKAAKKAVKSAAKAKKK